MRCIECGAYGYWRHECPRLIYTRPMSIPPTKSMRDYHSSRVHFVDVSSSLSFFFSVSSNISKVSPLLVENLLSHEEFFHDIVELLHLEESYSKDYYDKLEAYSNHSISRAYMATSPFVPSNNLLDDRIVDSGANHYISNKFE